MALLVLHSDVSSQRNVGELSYILDTAEERRQSEFVSNAQRLIMLAIK